jgi:uncharacterized phage infection (PIP) family protein YhgE
MADQQTPEDELKTEFEKLGGNLRSLIQGAWASEQRKRVSQEVQRGLNEVGTALSNAAENISQDPAAQRLREGVDELAERVRSGELAEQARTDLVKILQDVNQRLNELVDQLEASLEQGKSDGDD